MITTLDKALATLVMAIIFLLNYFGVTHVVMNQQTADAVNAVIVGIMPFLVYFIPNRQKGS